MKIRLTGATFDASAQTVVHASFSDVTLAGIQLITNVTDQVIIYNFADSAKGGTLATDTLTLEYDTTSMSDTDELMILVEDGASTQAVSGTVAVTNAGLTELAGAINASAQMDVNLAANGIGIATSAKQDTIIGHLDGVEGVLATIDADTGNISTKIDTVAGAVAGSEMQVDVLTMPTITVNAHAVTNAGTFAVQVAGAALTSLQLLDNAISGAGFNITQFGGAAVPIGAGLEATAIRVTLPTDGTGVVKLGAGTAEIGKLAAGVANIGDVDVASIAAGDNNIGNVDIVTVPADPFGVNADAASATGSISAKLRFIAGTGIPITGTVTVGSHAVTNAGTFVTQENGAALTALQLMDDTIFADDAAVTLGTSKGSIAAGVAVATDGTDPTAVSAEGDAAALRTDMNRLLIVNQTHPRFFHVSADYASAQTNASVKAAPGASLSLYITDIQVSNGAVAGNITLLDGSGGTVLYELYPAINGGAVLSLRNPIKLTANTALCITSTTVTTHSIFVSGYVAA